MQASVLYYANIGIKMFETAAVTVRVTNIRCCRHSIDDTIPIILPLFVRQLVPATIRDWICSLTTSMPFQLQCYFHFMEIEPSLLSDHTFGIIFHTHVRRL